MRLWILPFLLLLAGCQPPPEPPRPQPISFTRYQPFFLDVGRIEVIDEFQPPGQLPHIEHLMPYSPGEAMHIWVNDRLRAIGAGRLMQVIIKDASVMVSELPTPEGIKGVFTLSQDRKYDARLNVEIRIYGQGAMSEAGIYITSTRSITMREDASLVEREQAMRRLVFLLMEAANAQLEKNIYQYFGRYLNYSYTP